MRSFCAIAIFAFAVGCERAQTAGPATQPSGEPQKTSARIEAANAPTTGPVERAPSVVVIDQKPRQFPPAVLQLRNRDGQFTAILMSDDPKAAIEDDFHGNSFFLEMPLEISDVKDLSTYVYQYIAPSSDRADSPLGIFLDGNRLQLQPLQIQVKFDGDERSMSVMLSGQFIEFETRDDTTVPRQVQVLSKMLAEVKKK